MGALARQHRRIVILFPIRANFARAALGFTGDVPRVSERFVTAAHTSYTNAGKPACTAKMTKRNYGPARVTTLLQNLDSSLAATQRKREPRRSDRFDRGTQHGLRRPARLHERVERCRARRPPRQAGARLGPGWRYSGFCYL